MRFRLLVAGFVAATSSSALVSGQSTPRQTPAAPVSLPAVVSSAGDERALLDRYCVGCHNQKAKSGTGQAAEAARKLALDTLDTSEASPLVPR